MRAAAGGRVSKMASTLQQFLARAATRQRVVVIGGLAVIAHGLSRPTKDGDAWLDPLESAGAWAARLRETLGEFSECTLWSLAERRGAHPEELEEIGTIDGVVRVCGLNADLDIFYKPNGLECADFSAVWERALPWAEAVRVMEPLDLILTKEGTGREQDRVDITHLEGRLHTELGARLTTASFAEAEAVFARYVDHAVAARALENPDPAVQALARQVLAELAEQGDPFARDALGW